MMPQPSGSALPMPPGMGTAWRKTWQTDSDISLRLTVVENILQLFQKRRCPTTPEWQRKLPDFVKRLEEALYRTAATKDEYADQQTLESRLQAVAKRMTSRQPFRLGCQISSSSTPETVINTIPTVESTFFG